MSESIKEYWYLWLLLAVAVVALIYVWNKAIRRQLAKNEKKDKILKELRMMEQYKEIDEDTIRQVPKYELFDIIMSNIEKKIQSEDDNMLAENFNNLTDCQKYVYTMWYIDVEAPEKGICEFFSKYSDPLTGLASHAFKAIGQDKLAEITELAYEAYDENNEETSWEEGVKGKLNLAFDTIYDTLDIDSEMGEYILKNIQSFTS